MECFCDYEPAEFYFKATPKAAKAYEEAAKSWYGEYARWSNK